MIKYFFAFLLFLIPSISFAETSVTQYYEANFNDSTQCSGNFFWTESIDQAGADAMSCFGLRSTANSIVFSHVAGLIVYGSFNNSAVRPLWQLATRQYCPIAQAIANSDGTCPGTPPASCSDPAGTKYLLGSSFTAGADINNLVSPPSPACHTGSNCRALYVSDGNPSCITDGLGATRCYAYGHYNSDGAVCDNTNPPLPTPLSQADAPPATGCPAGTNQQIINGTTFCTPPVADAPPVNSDTPPTPPQTALDGKASGSAVNVTQNPDGTVTKSTTNFEIQTGGRGDGLASSADVAAVEDKLTPNVAPAVAGTLPDLSAGGSGWYTKTYTNGIEGVVQTRFNEMQATPLGGLITNLTPQINATAINGCFTFPILYIGNYQLCLPNGVLNFIGIIMILTALFSARSIIFGG